MEQPEVKNASGLAAGMGALLKSGLDLIGNRLELATLELAELRFQLFKLVIFIALGLVLSFFAVGYWSALLVALTWEHLGWKILLILALVFSLLGWALFVKARAMVRQGKLSLPSTFAELRKDGAALKETMHE